MNTKFFKAWFSLTLLLAFSVSASAADRVGYGSQFTIQTAKVDGKLIGFTTDGSKRPPVGFKCPGWFESLTEQPQIVYPDPRDSNKELKLENAGRTHVSAASYSPTRPLSERAAAVICSGPLGEFQLQMVNGVVDLVTPVSYSANSWNDVLNPF
ncbi:MAG: hypothetical protein KF799_01320 [Bdellovibrionales bacterium]|nr:hypothetical protein [Bdellovibrionales bacterium]